MSGPYSLAASAYLESGWSPVPFPAKSKFPPVDGYTGASGSDVDELTLRRWLKSGKVSAGNLTWFAPSGNIGLRLPRVVIGIDVDMYEGKAGRETFTKAKEAWGELPPTWYTSSRKDGSGIRLYRIPAGLAWPGKLPQGGGVELIRWDHRYAMVSPSIHDKTGLPYLWFVEDANLTSGAVEEVDWTDGESYGLISLEEFPDVDQLPELPATWVAGLTSGKRWTERAAADLDEDDVRLWLSDRNGPEICSTMRATLAKYERQIRQASDDGGTHDEGRNGAWALLGDAHAGHSGIEKALGKLRKVFIAAVTSRRSDKRLAAEEWSRIVVRGVQKVSAEGDSDGADICELIKAPGAAERAGDSSPPRTGSSHLSFARTDSGNAERMAHAHRGEQLYVDGFGWYVWRPEEERWCPDKDGTVNRRAISVARGLLTEAEYLAEEDPKEYGELKKFARASENIGKLRAMVDICKDLNGMNEPLSAFDADPARLGRILLKPNPGVEVTHALPEHRVTMRLGAEFVRHSSKEWDRFLRKVQPDPDILEWLQRLVGYSLYGSNPKRLFVANLGVSSTGKTTFMESLRAALGDYACIVNMTIYRDNQDDKPRPDIIGALRKRIVMSEETSAAWHLHGDQVKRITGGAPMKARGMRSNEFVEIAPAFTPWIFVNNPPTIEGADAAVLRRLVVVPWSVVIPESAEDSSLRERLMAGDNRRAVLAWALEGWTRYAEDSDLSAPAAAIPAREKFLSELSDLDRALWEIAVLEEEAYCLPTQLYNVYKHWAMTNGVRVESATKFGTFLSGRGLERVQKRIDGKPTWVRCGIRISAEYAKLFSGS